MHATRTPRRTFLRQTAAGLLTGPWVLPAAEALAQIAGERPQQADGVAVLNPCDRVPLSFIIDDSTCLVNMGHYCMPQFHQTWPDRPEYQQPWREWPREIPDAFVRKFGTWCAEHGVKGKYSVVPNPACVGWLDRMLPGWSQQELRDSLKLVRDLMLPNWDIHPEMITHTRVMNLKTGRPYEQAGPEYMENWNWTDGKSVDELAAYLAYALKILKNVDLPCEGITTPGGFAGRVKAELAQASFQAVRDVYGTEIPHYFKYLTTNPNESTEPRVEYARNLTTDHPECVVNIIAGTGDWFGGWTGVDIGSADKFITPDLQQGRMVEMIDKREPAILLCHWPGIYCNGNEAGFNIFKTVVGRLDERYGKRLIWMKLSEIARYWAAKELTQIELLKDGVRLRAPYAAPAFTVKLPQKLGQPQLVAGQTMQALRKLPAEGVLEASTYKAAEDGLLACFDLPRGVSEIRLRQ